MNTAFIDILKKLIAEQGKEALLNPAKCKAFLADYTHGEYKKESRLLLQALEAGVQKEIDTTEELEICKQQQTRVLQEEYFLTAEIAADVVDTLSLVLKGEASKTQPESPQMKPQPIPDPVPVVQATYPKKKNRCQKKIFIITALVIGITAIIGISYWLYTKESPLTLIHQKEKEIEIEIDEYDNIILEQKKNYDKSRIGSMVLTLKHVQNVQKFIREKFKSFDFEEMGYITDDYRNELRIKDFNDNPYYATIYLNGIKKMAGYSSVYSHLGIYDFDEGEGEQLYYYYFSIDEEYSDCSGIEYFSSELRRTKNDNSLHLLKFKYSDVNEYYWEVYWDSDISNKDKKTLLESFLRKIRYTKVFENIDLEWFKEIYTGINEYQQIRDLLEPSSVQPTPALTEQIYKIGDTGPAGGIIFYDKGIYSNGWRYLEAAPSSTDKGDNTDFPSHSSYAEIIDRSLGAGLTNTRLYLEKLSRNNVTGNTAPKICDTLVVNGYNDWYLPSLEELLGMYNTLRNNGNAGFLSRKYWSSTCYSNKEQYSGAAIFVDFSNGSTGISYVGDPARIRACRQF